MTTTRNQIVAHAWTDGRSPALVNVSAEQSSPSGHVTLTVERDGQRVAVEFDLYAALALVRQIDAITGEF